MEPSLLPHWSASQFVEFFGTRIIFAMLCGGIVGLERELKQKAAGIKTNMLICVGAALYTAVSILVSQAYEDRGYFGDPARIAAQIVSGIGFLGGGAIIQSRGTIHGLTTAATIWVVAAIGICIGLGFKTMALAASISVVLILVAVTFIEERFVRKSFLFICEIVAIDPESKVRKSVQELLDQSDLILDDFDAYHHGEKSVFNLRYRGDQSDQKKFLLALWMIPGIVEVKQQ